MVLHYHGQHDRPQGGGAGLGARAKRRSSRAGRSVAGIRKPGYRTTVTQTLLSRPPTSLVAGLQDLCSGACRTQATRPPCVLGRQPGRFNPHSTEGAVNLSFAHRCGELSAPSVAPAGPRAVDRKMLCIPLQPKPAIHFSRIRSCCQGKLETMLERRGCPKRWRGCAERSRVADGWK